MIEILPVSCATLAASPGGATTMHVPSAKKFGRPATLPEPLTQTLALLRPLIDAGSCNDPPRRLAGRGYGLGCCDGRPVILNANG